MVRSTTKHWQEHDGVCLRGLEEETVEHVFWRCPRYTVERQGPNRCGDAAARHLGGCQRRLGAPAKEAALGAWKAQQCESAWTAPDWRADEVFVDGSGRHPKDPAIRMVGCAVCAKVAGVWQSVKGWLRPGATVTAGEAAATVHAVEVCGPGGRIVTDCKAVYDRWHSIRNGIRPAADLAERCWCQLAEALRARPDVQCSWMPSHKSEAEAKQLGIPAGWHRSAGQADEAAKQISAEKDPPALVDSHMVNMAVAKRAPSTVAATTEGLKAGFGRLAERPSRSGPGSSQACLGGLRPNAPTDGRERQLQKRSLWAQSRRATCCRSSPVNGPQPRRCGRR